MDGARAPDGVWRNWSRSVEARPAHFERPGDEEEAAGIVRRVHARGGTLRAVAAGHSSNAQLVSDDTLLCTRGLCGVIRADRASLEAEVYAGTPLEALGEALYEHDLALPNYGDIATQTIGGAVSTGTHGTGITEPNLSGMLIAAELIDGRGERRRIAREDLDTLRAARVSLGALGVFTRLTLRLVPAFDAERREYAAPTDAALADLDALVAGNRSLDFYWYPRRDDIKLRLVNPFGGGTPAPAYGRLLELRSGHGHELIPTHSGIAHRFEESEFAMPYEAGVACFQALRRRVLARWRASVGWRVLWRTVKADDGDLSPASGRDTVTISLHQNASLPWREFFDDLEPVFRDHGGRPHWAKKHRLRAAELAPLYPGWAHFQQVRARFDPDGTFATPYMRALLGVPS